MICQGSETPVTWLTANTVNTTRTKNNQKPCIKQQHKKTTITIQYDRTV